MNRSFLAGLASGYFSIAVQCMTGLLLVPFLLSRHGVGLDGYGIIATLQAAAAAISVVFDGHRQESSRRLAQWIAAADRSSPAGLLLFTVLSTAVLVSVLVLLAHPLGRWLELPSAQQVTALRLALACILLEQFCYQLDSSLHAAGRSWIANALGAGDVALRAVLVVVFFMVAGAHVELFFVAALMGLSTRTLVLWITCQPDLAALRRPLLPTLREEALQFRRSLPLALNGIAPYIVFRLSIIAGNKHLGAEQAGVLAILLVTLRGYINQVVFSALRPMLVSRLALGRLQQADGPQRQRFADCLTLYQALIFAGAVGILCSAPAWLPLWLGEAMRPYAPYCMAAVAAYFLEIAWGIPYYALVAYNQARRLALMNGAAAIVIGGTLFGAARFGLPLWAYVGAVAVYLMLYVLFVRHDFRRLLQFETGELDAQLPLFAVAGGVGCWVMLHGGFGFFAVLGASATAVAAFVAAYHLSVMPMSRAVRLIWPRAT